MTNDETERLGDIATHWTQVRKALMGEGPDAAQAQGELFQRYGGTMRRYLHAALGDGTAVDDVMQEFAVAVVSGGLRGVQPERGRFRDYVKGVLFRLVRKQRRAEQRRAGQLDADVDLADPDTFPAACDEEFKRSWREELLDRTWDELARAEPTFYKVLHFRTEHPDLAATAMAAALAPHFDKPLSVANLRQTLHRARKRFKELLLEQIAGSLELPTPTAIHEELCDLDLASFVLKPRA